jgi:hypothetical protein
LKAARLDARKLDTEKAYIVSVRDGSDTDKIKRERLARHAISLQAFRLLNRFRQLAEGKRKPVPWAAGAPGYQLIYQPERTSRDVSRLT